MPLYTTTTLGLFGVTPAIISKQDGYAINYYWETSESTEFLRRESKDFAITAGKAEQLTVHRANYDIQEYTEPDIPVGAVEVHPASFMAGWSMGQIIRGIRG